VSINRFTLKLISPAFIAGSDKNHPEMRASSVRGQLRYWLRAIIGAENTNLDHLHKEESKIFGSTSAGSMVSVRVYRDSPAKIDEYPMLPHRINEGRRGLSIQKALIHGQNWDLELVTRPGVSLPKEALDALVVWSLLGGIGRRSRRMFGGVQITPKKDDTIDWYRTPQSPDELMDIIRDQLKQSVIGSPTSNIPTFPTLNPAHSWVMIGRNGYDTYEDVVKDLFKNLLRIPQFIAKEETFGGISPRRSSPLIAQVRRIGKDKYYPVLTAIRSKPDAKIDWTHLKKFMEASKSYFDGEKVWGGWE